jgi:hypothetical protein
MIVKELIEMLGEYPAYVDVEVVVESGCSLPLTRDGLEIDVNGGTLYLGGCDPAHE